MLTVTTPRNYRAQCAALSFLKERITESLSDPANPTQVNPAWTAAAQRILRDRGASTSNFEDLDHWIEDENESGLLRGTEPRVPTPATTRHQDHVAVDRRGDPADDETFVAGVYAVSGGALLIRGRA